VAQPWEQKGILRQQKAASVKARTPEARRLVLRHVAHQ
jgi:hypothetical protein